MLRSRERPSPWEDIGKSCLNNVSSDPNVIRSIVEGFRITSSPVICFSQPHRPIEYLHTPLPYQCHELKMAFKDPCPGRLVSREFGP